MVIDYGYRSSVKKCSGILYFIPAGSVQIRMCNLGHVPSELIRLQCVKVVRGKDDITACATSLLFCVVLKAVGTSQSFWSFSFTFWHPDLRPYFSGNLN